MIDNEDIKTLILYAFWAGLFGLLGWGAQLAWQAGIVPVALAAGFLAMFIGVRFAAKAWHP